MLFTSNNTIAYIKKSYWKRLINWNTKKIFVLLELLLLERVRMKILRCIRVRGRKNTDNFFHLADHYIHNFRAATLPFEGWWNHNSFGLIHYWPLSQGWDSPKLPERVSKRMLSSFLITFYFFKKIVYLSGGESYRNHFDL